MPGPVTVPLPALVTCTPVTPRSSAVVLTLAVIVKSHSADVRPAHGPPVQLRNLLPASMLACRKTWVPCATSTEQRPSPAGPQSRSRPPIRATPPWPLVPAGVFTATFSRYALNENDAVTLR